MLESKRLTLIIDANNLAHYLDHLTSGQGLSAADIFRLAVHLRNYAKSAQPPVVVELCFDPLPPDFDIPHMQWVHCLVAPAHSTGDDLLRERFRYYHHMQAPCMVITNDGEVREDVEEEGGTCLLVYDFVRRAGRSPIFLQPGDFQAAPSRRTVPKQRRIKELDWSRLANPTPAAPPNNCVVPPTTEVPAQPAPDDALAAEAYGNETPSTPPSVLPQIVYRLAIENWPIESGLRFLLDSFCPAHRKSEEWMLYQSLNAKEIRSNDLLDLASLLRDCCGSEDGFAQRGALMKRVRLALIQAGDHRLSLAELAQATGLNPHGLQGRIREKAEPWVEIIRGS